MDSFFLSFFLFFFCYFSRSWRGARGAGSSFHRSLFKVSWLCMVTRSKSYVHSWHFVIIVRPVRQEIVHHARTYGGRVKGNESPSSLRAFGSLAFRAMLSVYTPSVFSLVPPSLQHFSPVPSLSLSISLSFTKTFTIWTVYADVIGGGCRRKRKKGRSIRRIISEEETRGLGISSYILIHVFFALQTGMNLFRFPIIREKSEIERIVHRLQKRKREKTVYKRF